MDGVERPGFADRGAIRRQIAGQGTLKDPEILQRDLGERLGRPPKFLASTSEAYGRTSPSATAC
jgi:hypothetical protein